MSEKMSASTNAINWFEIPAKDLDRAQKFYEAVFAIEMQPMEMEDYKMRMFPYAEGKVGGALVQQQDYVPSMEGVLVYLNANPEIRQVVGRVEAAGGKVLMPAVEIGSGYGYMALLEDTEGNRIGLHANG